MLLNCKRDRSKEKLISCLGVDARILLSLLNQYNIQHFTFDTLTNDIAYTSKYRTKVLPKVRVNAFIIDSICTICNKTTEILKLIEAYKPSMNTPDFFDVLGYALPSDLQKVFGSTQAVKPTISRELIDFILVKAGIASVQEAEKLLTETKSKKFYLEMKLKLLKQRLANRDY